jgi:hypothetical protein
MKYLIIIAILSLSIAEKTKCSTDSKKVEMCVEIYIPVCAYSEDGQVNCVCNVRLLEHSQTNALLVKILKWLLLIKLLVLLKQ